MTDKPNIFPRWNTNHLPDVTEAVKQLELAGIRLTVLDSLTSYTTESANSAPHFRDELIKLLEFVLIDDNLLAAYARCLLNKGIDVSSVYQISPDEISAVWDSLVEHQFSAMPLEQLIRLALDLQFLLEVHICVRESLGESTAWANVLVRIADLSQSSQTSPRSGTSILDSINAIRKHWKAIEEDIAALGSKFADFGTLVMTMVPSRSVSLARRTPRVTESFYEGELRLPDLVAAQWSEDAPQIVKISIYVIEIMPDHYHLKLYVAPPLRKNKINLHFVSVLSSAPLTLSLEPLVLPADGYYFGDQGSGFLTKEDVRILVDQPSVAISIAAV